MINFMTLSEVCTNIVDCPHESPKWLRDGIPVIRNFNLVDGQIDLSDDYYVDEETYNKRIRRAIPSEGDIIFSREAPIGNCAIIPSGLKCCLGQRLVLLQVNKEICSPEYLLTVLLSDYVKRQIDQVSRRGSIVSNFNISELGDLSIPIIDNQEEISDFTSTIGKKIANNKLINKELETMAKTIYDYWFLQFDYPDENGKPYKASGGKMVWNEELKREIPEGWCAGTLSRYIAKDKGGDWGKEVEEGNYIKRVVCLRGADFPSITGNAELVAPVRYILEKNMCKILENGDLIIEISGGSPTQSTGRICYINHNLLERFDTDIVTSNFCKAISLNEPNYMYWFYIQWLKIYDNNVLFKYEGKTTGIKNLLFEIFVNDYTIAVPPDALIIQYNNIVCVMFEEIQKKQKESQELASLRDFLLPLLINGQVEFK